MRKKIIAGNWKMHKDLSESITLISELKSLISAFQPNCEVVICPPYISLETSNELLKNTQIKLGAQNICSEDEGAYTGEISAKMIQSVGCSYVIIGHSERRTIFHESDDLINKKLVQAIKFGLKPIFCIGETLVERESNITFDILKRQITIGLKGLSSEQLDDLIIAYEPVWAIGTGKVATPEQAQEAHKFIRDMIGHLYSKEIADRIVIQYGGSVKPDNSSELLNQPDIDGALVGGACLKADSFVGIIKSC